jgi:hypothetical protein
MRAITDARARREVRLLEGLVSFKQKGGASDHQQDGCDLRSVAWGETGLGHIECAEKLAACKTDALQSAFAVAGMNYGVPPVVLVRTTPQLSGRAKGR